MATVGVYRVAALVLLLTVALCRGVPVGIPRPRGTGGLARAIANHRYDQQTHQLAAIRDNPQNDAPVISTNTTTEKPRKGSQNAALKFMQQFGYMPKPIDGVDAVYTHDYFQKQVSKLQKFGDIPQTGELDDATLELMDTPRCGLPDLDPEDIEGSHRRKKRYIIGSGGWNKRNLTYYIANWSGKLRSKENVQRELRRAFDAWSIYSHLRFTEVDVTQYQDADIQIFFAEYDHHDGYSFDGPSGILAHAYYPYEFGHYGGDVHFDESEEWTMHPKDDYSGLDFFTVAVHELGHSLGLSHSPVGGSIMFPYYKGYDENFALDYDDVMAMWELYIKRKLDGDDEFIRHPTTSSTESPAIDDDESHQGDAADDGNNDDDHISDNDNNNDDSDNENDNNVDTDYANDDDQVKYHGDYETVDEHKRRVGRDKTVGPDLPNLPTLSPDSDSHSTGGEDEGRKGTEEDDFYGEDRKRREEESRKREEERKRKAEEDAERKRWEEDIKRKEDEIRRREKEERRKWEEEERQRDEPVKPTVKPKKPAPVPDICDGNFDAIGVIRQELFIFKGQYLWRFTERNQLRQGYPSHIRNMFPSLPSYLQKIDAVYEKKATGQIVFFIGKYYYVHNGDRLEEEAKPITDFGLPEILTELDSVFFWPRAKKLYFFSRHLYWRYNETTEIMDKNYPRGMDSWNGLPTDIQAAFTYTDGNSYFFKGKDYWRYNNQNIAPDNGYPRNAATDWCGC